MALVPYNCGGGAASPVVVSQSVPVTTAVPIGDSIFAAVGTNTASTINTVADSKGNTWVRASFDATSPALGLFYCAKVTAALTTSDTFTITNSATGAAAEQWVFRAMTTNGVLGAVAAIVNATSQNPVAGPQSFGTNPSVWCCVVCANTNGGGAPTVSGLGFGTPVKQQNGTNQVVSISDGLFAAPSAQATWNLVGSVANAVAIAYFPIPPLLLPQQMRRALVGIHRRPMPAYVR